MQKKVVIGMSGGVDSAVAALLLKRAGYAVHGLYLITCSGYEASSTKAIEVANQIDIPLTLLDIRDEFHEKVIQKFARAYYKCETPSPCLSCNRVIKWNHLLALADELEASHVATGHYARVTQNTAGQFELRKGFDPQKDQSYMLSRLTQRELSRTIFPLGELNKHNIREIAGDFKIHIPKSEESQDLCFLQGTNYRLYLKDHFGFSEPHGNIQLPDGTILGEHQGLSNYTIGQRKGLPVYKHALFVIRKDRNTNALIVGGAEDLGRSSFTVSALNWISGTAPHPETPIQCKIRYQAKPVDCEIELSGSTNARIQSHRILRDITPGQFAVFYTDDLILGSGIIRE